MGSLSFNTLITVIINLSSEEEFIEETVNSLKFGMEMRQVTNKVKEKNSIDIEYLKQAYENDIK